ncbi:hypothetical protein ACUJ46_01940 [Sandaracinobacteroides sp. A072]|uniref:hypothetical protein n=1 Tax=Sandaracinobacteroides sp. A072 TaxID=3461146 RepID=UPI0040425021
MMTGFAARQVWGRETVVRDSGRRAWASTAILVAGTIAVAITSYSLSLKVSAERRDTDRLERQVRGLETDLKALNAELRVRMRLPQLQRWNDEVLGLVPISASQYLQNPVHLAYYGKAPEARGLPQVQLAVRDVAGPPATAPAPQLVSAEVAPAPVERPAIRPAPAAPAQAAAPAVRLVSAPAPVASPAPGRPVRPAQVAPDDLLRQVELTFQSPPGIDD